MTITELIPTVQGLSHTEKLLLLQILVQELIKAEDIHTESISSNQTIDGTYKLVKDTLPIESPIVSEQSIASLTLQERQNFLKQPLEERQQLLAQQAEAMADHYVQNTEWQELSTGDIVEY
ncbi:hypothetical protein [Leptothoe spongobia]|uniref:Uncharacterized protein n=1 Tax=Leptothoe spongobia TAU-MAC 1115 TaxID=1967444 RepID=A0A947DIJ3_9CYAN|nr:hypothetical protein [Leptothoe spongobia]MBT9317597.1 hypothetical protein [Leptothoe spongobia TAU-MAC 1115]